MTNSREKIAKGTFYLAYAVYLLWKLSTISMLSLEQGSRIYTVIHGVVLLLLAFSSVLTIQFDRELICAAVLGVIGACVYHFANDVSIIDLALMLYASKCTDFKSIAKYSLAVLGTASCLVVIASQVGLVQDVLFPRGNELSRHGLGYLYCTNFSHLYLNFVLLILYLKRNKIKVSLYVFLLIIDGVIFYLTDSRNSCGLVVLALLGSICLQYCESNYFRTALKSVTRCAFIGITLISLVCALAYDGSNGAWKTLNKITSNRIAQDNASIYKYGVTPFGQEIDFANRIIAMGEQESERTLNPEGDKNIVESSFLNILITKGFVTLVAVLALFWFAQNKSQDSLMSLILLIIALHSAFDFQLIKPLYTTFLFWVWGSACGRGQANFDDTRAPNSPRHFSIPTALKLNGR